MNRLLIEGSRNGNAHVEINRFAFDGNDGRFPEFNITDCGKLWLKTHAFTDATKVKNNLFNEFILKVTNIKEMNIFDDAFSKASFHGYFRNIDDLQIFAKGFAGATNSKISITSVTIDKLQRIESSLKEIKIVDSSVKTISKDAFDVISLASIVFQNCKIGVIEANVFSPKVKIQIDTRYITFLIDVRF